MRVNRRFGYAIDMADSQQNIIQLLEAILIRLEALTPVPGDVRQVQTALTDAKDDIRIMRAVVTDHSYELKAYGERLRDLEISY